MKKKDLIWHFGLIIALFVLLMLEMRCFEDSTKIFTVDKNTIFMVATIVIWIALYLIIKGITGKTKLSLGIVVGVETAFDIINYIVRTARGSAIALSDISAIRTALSVSGNLKLSFDLKFIIGIDILALIIILMIIFRKKFIEAKLKWQIRVLEIVFGIIFILYILNSGIYDRWSLWDMNDIYREAGTPISILRMIKNIKVKPPEGYNTVQASKILNKYENLEKANTDDDPNIIVIINESFCDYYNLYKKGTENPIPFFTQLSKGENVVSGVSYSSEYGGKTSNVEYEFLTQNVTGILQDNSYVFQQYIDKNVKSSIVENLKKQGYKTSGMHPWYNYAYSRNKVYKLFGFDSTKFKDDMVGLQRNFNNQFFDDRSTYEQLLNEINQKKKDEKVFEYVLTVQNHVSYIKEDPTQKKYSDLLPENVYMQLLHESDEAFKQLIDEIKKKDEKYIVLMFGDHQPNVTEKPSSVKYKKEFETPFVIWANYDIPEQYGVVTSTVYLQNYLLKAAGVKLSAMNNYMEELKKYFPILTKNFYVDKTGKIYERNEKTEQNYEKLHEYYILDYYRIMEQDK